MRRSRALLVVRCFVILGRSGLRTSAISRPAPLPRSSAYHSRFRGSVRAPPLACPAVHAGAPLPLRERFFFFLIHLSPICSFVRERPEGLRAIRQRPAYAFGPEQGSIRSGQGAACSTWSMPAARWPLLTSQLRVVQ